MGRACTDRDVLMSTDQKTEVCALGSVFYSIFAANVGVICLKMFCFITVEAGVFQKADDTDTDLTGPILEECVHAAT